MCTNDLARNGQAHPSSFEMPLTFSTIKLIEDSRLFIFRYARAVIFYVNDYVALIGARPDLNCTALWRILQCVIDEVRDHDLDQLRVYRHHWQIIRHGDVNLPAIGERPHLL